MDDKPKRPRPTEQPSPAADDAAERAAPTPVGDLASEAAVAAPAEMVPKDTYLRLAAEYDNFRKRTLKERTELWSKAQADLVQRLVDALDDLARFAHIEPSAETATTIHEGVDLVERKIWKEREAARRAALRTAGRSSGRQTWRCWPGKGARGGAAAAQPRASAADGCDEAL